VAKVSGAESQSYLGALPKQNLLTKSLSTEEEPRSPTYKYFESGKAFKENGSKHFEIEKTSKENGAKHLESEKTSKENGAKYFESEKASKENGAKHLENERNSKENGAKYFESEKTRLEKEERAAILALWKREHDDRAK
jgi:hypothetical protein